MGKKREPIKGRSTHLKTLLRVNRRCTQNTLQEGLEEALQSLCRARLQVLLNFPSLDEVTEEIGEDRSCFFREVGSLKFAVAWLRGLAITKCETQAKASGKECDKGVALPTDAVSGAHGKEREIPLAMFQDVPEICHGLANREGAPIHCFEYEIEHSTKERIRSAQAYLREQAEATELVVSPT